MKNYCKTNVEIINNNLFLCQIIFHLILFMMQKCIANCDPRHPLRRMRCQKTFKFTNFLRNRTKRIFNRTKELYCDTTIFVSRFFIATCPKKNGNWKMAQGCRLSPIVLKKNFWYFFGNLKRLKIFYNKNV